MKRRGFTIIELLVVVAAITILVAISVSAYESYQKRSFDAQAVALAAAVKSGAERYYATNNEYPLASTLFGGTPTGNPPATFTSASTILNVPSSNLNTDNLKFTPCAGTGVCSAGSANTSKVYYVTKDSSDGTAQRQYTITIGSTSCTFTFPTTESGALSFILMYYSYQSRNWIVSRSDRGDVTTSNTTNCGFTPL